LVQKTPTHHVKHHLGWEANIYIAPSLEQQLKSSDSDTRDNARSSVCIRFLKACRKKFNGWPGFYAVYWHEIKVTKLVPAPVPAAKSVVAATTEDSDDECDDCPMCDTGYHDRCRSGNCPVARRW
jgi:hypothetical protein